MASLCETCRNPGQCCTGFILNKASAALKFSSAEEVEDYIKNAIEPENTWQKDQPHRSIRKGLPFKPLYMREDGIWRFWFPILDKNGRCSDYENRPYLCRAYEAGSDSLRVEYKK